METPWPAQLKWAPAGPLQKTFVTTLWWGWFGVILIAPLLEPFPHFPPGVPSLPSPERLLPISGTLLGVSPSLCTCLQNDGLSDAFPSLFSVVPTSQRHPEGVRPTAQSCA